MKTIPLAAALTLSLLVACTGSPARPVELRAPAPATAYQRVGEPSWKERIDQPYVFLEHTGDYRELGSRMRELLAAASAGELATAGPPFALFFDDPSATPVSDLRSRACLPIPAPIDAPPGLGYAVLPRAMVAYAQVSGSYAEVPRAYPTLFAYLAEHGWTPNGPVREVYLVDPARAETTDDLVTEVQVPWSL